MDKGSLRKSDDGAAVKERERERWEESTRYRKERASRVCALEKDDEDQCV